MMEINKILRIFTVALAVLLMAGKVLGQYSGGNGSEGSPYLIANVADMNALATNVNGGNSYSGAYFKVTADINGVTKIIGRASTRFMGHFDGDGHTINLSINVTNGNVSTDGAGAGLFGQVSGAEIKNLIVRGTVAYNINQVAGIVGQANDGSRIENCINYAVPSSNSSTNTQRAGVVGGCFYSTIIGCKNYANIAGAGGNEMGGIVATCSSSVGGNSTIENCENYGSITGGNQYVGGIVGKVNTYNSYTTSIINCKNNAEIIGTQYAGGIAGYLECNYDGANAVISGCANCASVTGTTYAGGIAGMAKNGINIESCLNNGDVTVVSIIGGIAGSAEGKTTHPTSILHCTNDATITATKSDADVFCGGIVGQNKNISNWYVTVDGCCNKGNVVATSCGHHIGGLAGYWQYYGVIRNSWNTGEVSVKGGPIASDVLCLGGLVGNIVSQSEPRIGYLYNCYNTGNVITYGTSGNPNHNGTYIGGIVGECNGNISNCYNGGFVSNNSNSGTKCGAIAGFLDTYCDVSQCYSLSNCGIGTEANEANLSLYGGSQGSPTFSATYFNHSSPTTNTISGGGDLFVQLTAWVNGNSAYSTWLMPTDESDNKGMPKFQDNPTSVPTVQDLSVTEGDGQNTITWTAVPGAPGYTILWGTSGNLTNSIDIADGNIDEYLHTSLANGTEYCYMIVPNMSGPSCTDNSSSQNEVCATPAIACLPISQSPVLTIEAQTDRSVRVSWNSVPDASSYILYYGVNDPNSSTNNVWSVTNATSPMTIPELTNGQPYNFAVMPVGTDPYCPENPLSTTRQGTPNCDE